LRPSKSFVAGFSVFLAAFLTACATNYVSKNRQFKLISEKTEIEIGRKAKAEIVKEYGTYHDLDWQVYLDQIGQKVAKQSDRPKLAYDFTILDTDVLNAFALPGGFIFVTRGILVELADEAELAVVIGHEITHVAAWHGIEMLQRAGLLSTLTALGIIGGAVAGAPDAAIAIGQAAGVYEGMYLSGYGRKNELEADQHGIFYASKAGYDPEAAITFFQRLDKIETEEQTAQRISPYWRSHPLTSERLKKARHWIDTINQAKSPLNYNHDKYQAMVARIPRSDPKERGRIKGRSYTNDAFGLALEVPEGWGLDNSRTQNLVTISGPAPEVRGSLQRYKLPDTIGVQDFAKQVARQLGVQEASGRESEYPAGHGMVLQYTDGYLRYRTLLLVRGNEGYTVMCQIPSEQYLQYIVDCEKIMRSLQIE
jgi:predicted Zn-dependent protease